jgi:hypothetical protein
MTDRFVIFLHSFLGALRVRPTARRLKLLTPEPRSRLWLTSAVEIMALAPPHQTASAAGRAERGLPPITAMILPDAGKMVTARGLIFGRAQMAASIKSTEKCS